MTQSLRSRDTAVDTAVAQPLRSGRTAVRQPLRSRHTSVVHLLRSLYATVTHQPHNVYAACLSCRDTVVTQP